MAIVRVIVGSLVAHAVVLAMLDALVDGAPPRAPARPPVIELVDPLPEPAPIEVAIVEPPSDIARVEPPSDIARVEPRREVAVAIATTTPSAIETSSTRDAPTGSGDAPTGDAPIGTDAPAGTHSIRMRGRGRPGGPDLTLHEDVPHEAPPVETAPRSEKKLQQRGTEYVVPDLVTTMHVSRDGRASFEDKPDIEVHVLLPNPDLKQTARDLGNHLAGWYRDPYAQKNARRVQDMPRHEQAVPGGWDAGAGGDTNIDGSTKQPDELPRRPSNGIVPVIGGKLDITSWLHRKFIGDPYASRKRALLDGTRDQRAEIRRAYTREQLAQSAVTMKRNVDRVFRELRDAGQRRLALFALWDECAEGEDAAGEAGQRARAIVIGAIRGRLSGESDSYTADEIAALDAQRTSSQHFVPYEPTPSIASETVAAPITE
ncbi:MAG: hypothetical protein AB7T06_29520 [Kofleriaceae bacterium]